VKRTKNINKRTPKQKKNHIDVKPINNKISNENNIH